MTAGATDIEVVSLEAHEFEIACDFDSSQPTSGIGPHDDPAAWILYKDHECGSPIALCCERCKTVRYDGVGVILCGRCGGYFDNRELYYRAERINK